MATIIISPVAAIGKTSIRPAPNMTKAIKQWLQQFLKVLLQLETLIRLCPNIAQPPIPEKTPDKIFATP
jgi:hypothetical protein